MTVYFPDSPGDCPTGINCSVISCAEGAGGPPPRSTLIPTSATTNLRMVIRSPSSPSFDEERSRLLLLSVRRLRVPPSEEETPDGLVLEPPCLPEVGDGLRVKAAAPQHPDAVVRLASGAGEQSRSLRGGYGAARLQQLDALSDVLEHVDDPQEGGDRHDLRPIELDPLALGVDLRQRLARRRIVERLAVVEADRAFDGLDGIVVEERPGVRRLHQRRNVERAVARRAEPVAKYTSEPSPGAPSRDHPVRGPHGLCTEVRRPRVCGTPRMTNLFLRSSKPSRFSRISPNSRISAGFSKFSFKSGLNSATNRGLSFGSVAMNAGSMVKLFSAGWQVPQVRPLPANVSLKNRSLPLAMSWLKRSAGGETVLQPDRATTAHRTTRAVDTNSRGRIRPPSSSGVCTSSDSTDPWPLCTGRARSGCRVQRRSRPRQPEFFPRRPGPRRAMGCTQTDTGVMYRTVLLDVADASNRTDYPVFSPNASVKRR